jgi:plasmid maintenance system antidote protein VapI
MDEVIRQKIIDMDKEDVTLRKIAKEVGISHPTVSRILVAHRGIKRKGKPLVRLSPSQRQQALREIKEGKSLNSVAEKLDVNPRTLYRLIEGRGLTRKYKRVDKQVQQELDRLDKEGVTRKAMATRTGISERMVFDYFRKKREQNLRS